jgi:isocitrate lyase
LKEVEAKELSHQESSTLAIEMISISTNGKETPEKIGWNSQLARTREGYYRFNGCLQAAVNRALNFSPVSDLVWIETKEPNLKKAQSIAAQIHQQFPDQFSSSFFSVSFPYHHNQIFLSPF